MTGKKHIFTLVIFPPADLSIYKEAVVVTLYELKTE
jgi:hypothetical protein